MVDQDTNNQDIKFQSWIKIESTYVRHMINWTKTDLKYSFFNLFGTLLFNVISVGLEGGGAVHLSTPLWAEGIHRELILISQWNIDNKNNQGIYQEDESYFLNIQTEKYAEHFFSIEEQWKNVL